MMIIKTYIFSFGDIIKIYGSSCRLLYRNVLCVMDSFVRNAHQAGCTINASNATDVVNYKANENKLLFAIRPHLSMPSEQILI